MQTIDVHAPEVRASSLLLRFDASPASALYERTAFTLEFPDSIRLDRVPDALIALLPPVILHLHWALLAPCRVRLHYPLPPGALARLERLARVGARTLGLLRMAPTPPESVRIEAAGTLPEPAVADELPKRAALAFSGGKDSLVHVGLLSECGLDPCLVTVTSPLPPLEDHLSSRRRWVLDTIAERRGLDLVEVRSDARSSWRNDFSKKAGFPLYVNELTDTLLYTAALWVASASEGGGHTFLASENEVSETTETPHGIQQLPHFMYATPTLVALDELARPLGLGYGSLTSALHSAQVQRLLWTRYPDLRDLQTSCWRARRDQTACNACGQCLRVALGAIAAGGDPREMGIDLAALLVGMRGWKARTRRRPFPVDGTPDDKVGWRLHARVVADLRALREDVDLAPLLTYAGRSERGRALRAFRILRRRHRKARVGGAPGYRRGWLRFADSRLRGKIADLFEEAFAEEPEAQYADALRRTESIIASLRP